MTYSKREVSSANLTKLIAISHLSQVIVPFKSKMVIEESDENLEISIKLDSHDIFDTPPQLLSSFKSLNNTTEIDLSLIKSHLACSFESDENLDLEFILKDLVSNTPIEDGNLKELKEEESIENSDLLEESFEDLDIKNEAVLEISSFLMQSDDSDTENFVQEKVSIKQKIVLFIKGACFRSFINRKKVKVFLLFYISFFNAFYVPLNLIFDGFNYPIFILMIELMNTLFLAYLFFKKATKYNRALKRRDKQNKVKINTHKLTRDDENAIIIHLKTRSEIYRMLFFEFLYVIPFPLILEKIGLSHGLFFVLNLPRIVNVKPIIHGLRVFKEKNRLLGSILMILVLSIVFIHLFACILIAVALAQPDFNHSLLRKIPAPEYYIYKGVREKLDVTDSSIYIHGLYWVYATVSKSGVMEMQVVSLPERGFSIFVMTVGGLFYIFVFGNMVSLIEDLTPKMKSIMEKQEKKVMKLVRRLNFQALDERFESYFTHIWKSEKGFNENELLNNLPSDIKVSLQKSQYLPIFKKSNFFTHGKLIPQADSSLIYSLFKFLLSEVFIPEDIIIIAGDFCSKVYFILEGRVELFSLNLKQKIILHPGDFFGNILSDQRQPGYVRAITYCKIGYLNQETFDIMKERFPVWKDKMVSQMLGYKKTLLTDLSFFNEGDNKCNDSVNLKNKVIDEKLIEHYYSFYLKIELEKNDEKKNEKNIKNELEGLKNSNRFGFSSRKIAKTEGFEDLIRVSPSSKRHQRQNIVHLMSQSKLFFF